MTKKLTKRESLVEPTQFIYNYYYGLLPNDFISMLKVNDKRETRKSARLK